MTMNIKAQIIISIIIILGIVYIINIAKKKGFGIKIFIDMVRCWNMYTYFDAFSTNYE